MLNGSFSVVGGFNAERITLESNFVEELEQGLRRGELREVGET